MPNNLNFIEKKAKDQKKYLLNLAGGFRREFPNEIITNEINATQFINNATINLSVQGNRDQSTTRSDAITLKPKRTKQPT